VVRKEVAGLMTLNLRIKSKVLSSSERPGVAAVVGTAVPVIVFGVAVAAVAVAAAPDPRPKAKLCSPPAATIKTCAVCRPCTSVARQEEEEGWMEGSAWVAEAPVPSCPLLLAPIDQTCPLFVKASV